MSATPEQQATWDRLLLTAWKNDHLIFVAIKHFAMLENYEVFSTGKFLDYVRELRLQRYPPPAEIMKPARHFVGKYCLKLSAYLLSGGDVEAAIQAIGGFKWRKGVPLYTQDQTAKYRSITGRQARKDGGHNVLCRSARDADKRHDWRTTK